MCGDTQLRFLDGKGAVRLPTYSTFSEGKDYMTFLGMIITLIIGILMLIIGGVFKWKWLMLISIIPLGIALI